MNFFFNGKKTHDIELQLHLFQARKIIFVIFDVKILFCFWRKRIFLNGGEKKTREIEFAYLFQVRKIIYEI